MVVVVSCCEEQRSREASRTHVHAQPTVIKLLRTLYVANVEVNVAYGAAGWNSRPGVVRLIQ